MIQQPNKETFYVTPSLQNVITTPKGKILDIVLGNDVGVWEIESGRCLKVISGIASQNINKLYPFNPSNSLEKFPGEYFIIAGNKHIHIYDYEKQDFLQSIPVPDNLDIQYLQNQGEKMIILGEEGIYFFPNFVQNPEIFSKFDPKPYIKTSVVDKAILLENGTIVFYSSTEEHVFLINEPENKENSKIVKIFSNGIITSMIPLKDEIIAVGHNQSIHIIDTQRNCIKNMIKGYNEEYISLFYLKDKEQLASGTKKATIRIFDLKKCRSLAKFGSDSDLEYHQIFASQDQLVSVNNESRRLKVWNIQKLKDVKPIRFMQGGLKSVQNIAKINHNTIAMLTTRGEFDDGQMVFSQYIEIINIETNEHYLDKQIESPGYTIQPESFLYSQEQKEIFYLMKSDDITKSNLLYFQSTEGEQKLRKIELNVESHEKAYYSKYGRIIVPYSYNVDFSEILGFSTGQNQTIVNSGISVYNFDVKLQLKIQFNTNFLAKVVEMIDENNIMFINKDNKLEQWNIPQEKCVEIYETTTDVFSKMKYIDQFFFLYNENKEQFVIWSAEEEDVVQRRKAKKGFKKIELLDEDCIILYESGQIELWNVESGEYRYSKLNFHVQNFIVQEHQILLIGEGFMKITNRDTL